MMSRPPYLALLCLQIGLLAVEAEVRINEIAARSSERLIRWWDDSPPTVGSGTPWWDVTFDDSYWETHSGPIDRSLPAASIYVRKIFNIEAGVVLGNAPVKLTINFDDGFVAYLNGKEVARRDMGAPGAFNNHDQNAYNSRSNSTETIELGTVADLLLSGENILAVQVHTHTSNSRARFAADLELGGARSVSVVQSGEDFKTFIGYTEPSGGVFDPGLLTNRSTARGFVDWIELHNFGAEPADLTGWTLQNGAEDSNLWRFPSGTVIPPDGYLLVLADGLSFTLSPFARPFYMHTSFSLDGDGERLVLLDSEGTPVGDFPTEYPEQDLFHSYGVNPDTNTYAYLAHPTPGSTNLGPGLSGIVKAPKFDQAGGFHPAPITLTLRSNTEGAEIYYTTDGTTPSPSNGRLFQKSIAIERVAENVGTVIRTRAFKNGMIPSLTKTRTFLVDQAPALLTLPAVSITGDPERALFKPHGITSIVGGTRRGNGVWQVSDTATDYNIPLQFGRATERHASLEFRHPDGTDGFQTDIAIRIAGSRNHGRPRLVLQRTNEIPWPTGCFPGTAVGFSEKPSFNFFFRGDFGDARLEYPLFPGERVQSFNSIRARAGKNDVHTPFIRDEFARRLFKDMGQIAVSGNLTTLYVNGEYKGYYNLTERYKPEFFESWLDAGPDWDIRDRDGFTDGDAMAHNALLADADKDLTIQANYDAVAAQLDLANFADYLILNVWGATIDWISNNYFMSRERVDGARFLFSLWDAESMFGHRGVQPVTYDMFVPGTRLSTTGNDRPIANLWAALKVNEEFRLLFADRLQKHFFTPGGALTNENLIERFEALRDEIEPVMDYTIGETVETSSNSGCVTDLRDWINTREGILFGTGANPAQKHFVDAGVWPEIDAAVFSQHGGAVPSEHALLISAAAGTIYYTLDGSDPRLIGGTPNPSATAITDGDSIKPSEGTVILSQTRTIKARSLHEGTWSALTEAQFIVGLPAAANNLAVTELHYNPPGDQDLTEFVEFMNIDPSNAIDFTGVTVTGINYTFPSGLTLAPLERIVIVKDQTAFAAAYDTAGMTIAPGEFASSSLANGGEEIAVIASGGSTDIRRFTYDDQAAWPTSPDGAGFSLVLVAPQSDPLHTDPANWRSSTTTGGDPGASDAATPFSGDPTLDRDADGLNALLEHALGSSDLIPNTEPALNANIGSFEDDTGTLVEFLTCTFKRNIAADDLVFQLESSTDLVSWSPLSTVDMAEVNHGDGTYTVTFRSTTPVDSIQSKYIRQRVSAR